MKLILVRHGETLENLKGIVQGHMQGTLSRKGIRQAEKLAFRLKDESIVAIYSSDLKRAADTARLIAKYHPKTPLLFVTELRECNAGCFTGKKGKGIDWDNLPLDVETRHLMRARVKKLLDRVYEEHPDDTVLFIGHNGINRALISIIMNKPPEYMKEIKSPSNTSVSIFDIREDKNHKVHLLNCVKHLEHLE